MAEVVECVNGIGLKPKRGVQFVPCASPVAAGHQDGGHVQMGLSRFGIEPKRGPVGIQRIVKITEQIEGRAQAQPCGHAAGIETDRLSEFFHRLLVLARPHPFQAQYIMGFGLVRLGDRRRGLDGGLRSFGCSPFRRRRRRWRRGILREREAGHYHEHDGRRKYDADQERFHQREHRSKWPTSRAATIERSKGQAYWIGTEGYFSRSRSRLSGMSISA